MDLRHLRYFAAVAADGSFNRAAARLHIAQPAISRQIGDLEAELQITLFVRSAQGVKLSPAGEAFLAEVKGLLPQIELAKLRARRAAAGQFGLVRVAFATFVGELRFAMAAFAQAQRSMPDVDFRLTVIDSDQQLEAMIRGDIDVGLLHRRDPPQANIVYRDLRTDVYELLVPNGHPLTKSARVRLADLREHDMVLPPPWGWPTGYNQLMAAFHQGGLTLRGRYEATTEAMMVNMVAEGLAIAFVDRLLAERRPIKGCTYLSIEDFYLPQHLAAMWPRDRETPAILHFVDLLFQQMAAGNEIREPLSSGSISIGSAELEQIRSVAPQEHHGDPKKTRVRTETLDV